MIWVGDDTASYQVERSTAVGATEFPPRECKTIFRQVQCQSNSIGKAHREPSNYNPRFCHSRSRALGTE